MMHESPLCVVIRPNDPESRFVMIAPFPIGELIAKMRMCAHLNLRPLFIVRMAPKSYIEMVRRNGGFTLVFKHQLYPHGHARLAERVREELGLPVDSPAAIQDGTVQRFLKWHLRHLPSVLRA